MILITEQQHVINVTKTPAGGRTMTLTTNGQTYKVYTHPSRAKEMKRFEFDVKKLEAQATQPVTPTKRKSRKRE